MNCNKLKILKYCFILGIVLFSGSVQAQLDTLRKDSVSGILQKMTNIADWGVDLLTFEREEYTFFILPLVGYEERTKLELGVMPVWRFYIGEKQQENQYFRPSSVAPSIIYSTSGMYEFDVTSDFYTRNKWYIRNKWLYQWMPDKFYPIGNVTDKNLTSDFEIKKLEFLGKIMKGINNELFVGINYDVGSYDVKNIKSEVLNQAVLGYNGGKVVGVGPVVSYDSRNDVVYPDAGSFLTLEYTYYPPKISDYSFSSVKLDARKYFKLGEREKVLATQFYLKSTINDAPFFRLPVLGGKRLFRGIARPYKYMDNNSIYIQAAYRSHLWWRLGYELFTGAGNVYENWDSSIYSNIHLMGGLGLRVRVLEKEKLSLRFDYGLSSNGDAGFFFTLGEAF